MRENKRREQTIGETMVSYQDVIELLGDKPIGEWKGQKYVGEYKDGKEWNGKLYDKNGNIIGKYVNGKYRNP